MDRVSPLLCFTGTLLFLLGLLTGFGIPLFRTPRIGLSAHLAAIESGLGLIAFGLMWPHLALPAGWSAAIGHAFWISLYVLWIGLLLGAVWGTGRSLPIAGEGFTAIAWQENTARALISLGAVGSAGAVIALLLKWSWTA
jgi:hydroxylaminobenzene mutase